MTTEQPKTIRLADYRASDYRIDKVCLVFDLGEETTRVRSQLEISGVGGESLVLDGEDLKLVSLALDGRVLGEDEYSLDETSLTIPSPPAGFTLDIETEIRPAENTKLDGLYISNGVFCTQCEAEGFRRITYFLDRPDVMAVYTTVMRADAKKFPVMLSNGNLISDEAIEDGRRMVVWRDPFPKPSYLFALVAGDLACFEDSFTTASGRDVALRIYVEHGKQDRCAYAMDSLKRAMRWDEERFGLEYDLDLFNIVAVSDFNMGAMENKSLNVFNDKYVLADPETATDADYAHIEAVIAHEYFHNWTGDRVTCRDWFQLSLKEGLTVFRDQEFSADQRSRAVKRIADVRILRGHQFPEDQGPLAHSVRPESYIEINNFYTATVYEKGAEVIRMIHTLLGEAGFQEGMKLYFERHDGQAVTCDDFVAAMSDATDTDLSQFKLWYSQAGTPELTIDSNYDAAARVFSLTVAQHCPETPGQEGKQPMHIPLRVGLLDDAGNDMTERLLNVTEASQTFSFADLDEPRALSVNRNFSAPVNISLKGSEASRGFLMARDADPFNRWEAAQQYATDLILNGGDNGEFIEALGQILQDQTIEKAFAAQVLALPGEDYLAGRAALYDPVAIHQARESLRNAIAERHQGALLEVYSANRSNQPFSPDADQAGQRALKNAALSYIASLENPAMEAVVYSQYNAADNMTDRVAALRELVNKEGSYRAKALDDFYTRFSSDSLVIDKWMGLQAISSLPDVLDRVTELLEHEVFSLKRPNKVYALIGGFASGNPLHFHDIGGAGYAFLADRVLELDGVNPQIGARILAPLGRWQRLDETRQGLMKSQLERILAKPGLSSDILEIASS